MENSKYFNGLASSEFEQLRESTQGLLKINSKLACALHVEIYRRVYHLNQNNTQANFLRAASKLSLHIRKFTTVLPDQTQQDLALIA